MKRKNMRKIFPILITAALVVIISVLSCSRGDNPFSVNPGTSNTTGAANLLGPGSIYFEPGNASQLTQLSRPLYILFDRYMDAATIDTSNITVDRVSGSTETPIEIIIDYSPGSRTVTIIPVDGEFPDDAAFVLTLSNQIKDFSGAVLDGNGNGVADSARYDNYLLTFYTGTGNSDLPDFTSPTISGYYPPTDITQIAMDSASFRISLTFTGGDIDTNDLTTSILRLYRLSEVNGISTDTTYVPNSVAIESRTLSGVTYRLPSPDDTMRLARGNRYLVQFMASAVSDTSGNPLLWGNEVNDGSIANFYFGFLMQPASGQDITPPTVVYINIDQFNNNWRLIGTFSEVMDTSTFNSDNIAVFDSNKNRLDGYFIKQTGMSGFAFYTRQRTVQPFYYYFTTAVTDSVGNMLDGNGDGRGGEDEDIYTNLPPGP